MMDIKAFFKLTYGLYVVGVKTSNGLGGCIVDAVMQTTTNPATLVLCAQQSTLTHKSIEETKKFTLSVLSEDVDPFVIGNFGFQSCREVNKWEKVPHHFIEDIPVLDKAAAYLYCEVSEIKRLSTHTLFFCNVLDAIDAQGKALSYTTYQESWKPKVIEAFKKGQLAQNTIEGEKKMAEKYVCDVCGYEYDGETPFEELGDDFACPLCGVGKDQFSKVES